MRGYVAILLAVVPALTAVAADDGGEQAMRLTVRPMLCIIDRRTPQCNMSFLVIWESGRSGYYCLFNDFAAAPLRCWNEERTGELTEERVVSDEFRYWMSDSETDTDSPLAAVKVEVLRMDDDDRRRKRRRRHVWDIL